MLGNYQRILHINDFESYQKTSRSGGPLLGIFLVGLNHKSFESSREGERGLKFSISGVVPSK